MNNQKELPNDLPPETRKAVGDQLQRLASMDPGTYFEEACAWVSRHEPNASGGNRTRLIAAYQAGRQHAEQLDDEPAKRAFDIYNENVAMHADPARAVQATKGLIFSNRPATLENGCVLIVNDHLQWLIAMAETGIQQANDPTPRVEHSSSLRGVFYVYLKGDIPPGGAKTTRQVTVNVDYDENGEPIGIEYGT